MADTFYCPFCDQFHSMAHLVNDQLVMRSPKYGYIIGLCDKKHCRQLWQELRQECLGIEGEMREVRHYSQRRHKYHTKR